MYNFQLNIGSLSSPMIGGGWVDVSPVYEKASLNKALEQNEIYARVKLEGSLMFEFDDFTALDTLRITAAKCDIRALSDSVVIFEGELDLWGAYKENICTLKIVPDDEYTLLLTNKSKKVNILNTTSSISCNVNPKQSKLTFYDSLISQSSLWYTWTPFILPVHIYAREEYRYANHIADLLDGTSGWAIVETYPDNTKRIARTWSDAGFSAPNPLWFTSQAILSGDSINDIIFIDDKENTITARSGSLGWMIDNDSYYSDNTITYSRFRKLKDVIEFIVGEFDSSIQFNDDTWTYLDANDDLKYLLIANVSDLILAGGAEKTDPQEFGYLTFTKLMAMLRKKFKLYWKLQTISSVVYFRIKHRSEVNYTAGSLDLQSYEGTDWTRDDWKYNDLKKFNRLQREVVADNLDFLGTDVLIPSLDNIAEPYVIGDEKWYFDIWDIMQRGGDIYPDDKDDEFCMITVEPIEVDGVELLTNITNTSGYESLSYSAGTLTAENITGNALAQSNAVTTVAGHVYRIVLNLTSCVGEKPEVFTTGGDLGFTRLADGENILYVSDTGLGTMVLFIRNTNVSSFTIEDISIEKYIYTCRMAEGALIEDQVANAELSMANLDAGHGQYELPDTPATINLTVTDLTDTQLLKDKEQATKAPLRLPTDVDAEELFTTNKGELEFDSLKIPLSGDAAEITGRFL